jgi:hypothetical protein
MQTLDSDIESDTLVHMLHLAHVKISKDPMLLRVVA